MPDPHAFPIDEQESGSYIATITDDTGAMLPGSVLVTLKLSLFVVRQDGSITYIRGPQQNVLNVNQVDVFDVLQTLPDGRTYNLRWRIQPADTTLVEALPYERHQFVFEWGWPSGQGKHPAVLVVRNLVPVT